VREHNDIAQRQQRHLQWLLCGRLFGHHHYVRHGFSFKNNYLQNTAKPLNTCLITDGASFAAIKPSP
jgi:hypothetical protein